jgi:hypothetical protein
MSRISSIWNKKEAYEEYISRVNESICCNYQGKGFHLAKVKCNMINLVIFCKNILL